jgi:hypothetical protein
MSEHEFDSFRVGQRQMSAGNFNNMVDALYTGQDRLQNKFTSTATNQIYIKNGAEADLETYSVLQVDTVAQNLQEPQSLQQFKSKILVEGIVPVVPDGYTPDSTNRICVLQAPAMDGGYAKGIISGPVQVQVDIQDASHDWADFSDGVTANLISGVTGSAYIVDRAEDSGVVWCLVWLNAHHHAASHNPLTDLSGGWDLQDQGTVGGNPATGVKITIKT